MIGASSVFPPLWLRLKSFLAANPHGLMSRSWLSCRDNAEVCLMT